MTTSDERLDEVKDAAVSSHGVDLVTEAMSWCDSPIEQIFLLEMLAQNYAVASTARVASEHGRPWVTGARGYLCDTRSLVAVQADVVVAERKARVDFAIASRAQGRIVVELDGHNFHERTKEQAARDRSRDRQLSSKGWRVIRFTGSEVVRDITGNILQDVWTVERVIADERGVRT